MPKIGHVITAQYSGERFETVVIAAIAHLKTFGGECWVVFNDTPVLITSSDIYAEIHERWQNARS